MTTKYGVFSETGKGGGKPNPYVDTVKPDPRDHGLNFKSPTCKVGKLNDACFTKVEYSHDPFVEPLKSALQQKNASLKKNVTDRPWKVASPMKQSACPGDWIGTCQGKPLESMGGTTEVKLKKGEVPEKPPNIKAGLCNTAAIRKQLARGVAGEYEYIADPIHQATRKPAAANPVTPFRPVNPPKKGGPGTVTRNFGGRAKGACGEFAYVLRGDDTDQTSASSDGTDAAVTSPAAAGTAFRPSAYPHKGPMATFNRFPEYLHDPETVKAERRRQQLAKERELLAARSGAWRPGGQVKTDATRSIVRMNL